MKPAHTRTDTVAAGTPRSRFLALPEARRAQLLDPAEAEFGRYGFSEASLNRILSAADMSKGQAYHYVEDKGDLYALVMDRALNRLVAHMALPPFHATTPSAFWGQLRHATQRVTVVLTQNPELAALARGIYQGVEVRTALAEVTARIHTWLDAALALGQRVGAIRDDLPRTLLANALFAVAGEIDRWFAEHWDELTGPQALRLNDNAFQLLVVMATPPRRKPPQRTGASRAPRRPS